MRLLLVLTALGLAAVASAQQVAAPPAPLWRMAANGDAVQTDLGFILPARWRDFERKGFTSSRPDGASVMTYYERADGLRLNVLIQLRVDVRGVPMPGADGLERNWSLVQFAASAQYLRSQQGEPERLAEARIDWGTTARPNAMMQLLRYRLANGTEIQGTWYRNIGTWAVVVVVSGAEDRRADIEATGRAVMTGMAWPGAPLTAELRALAPQFPRDLPECGGDFGRTGAGQPVDPGPVISALIGTALSVYFLDTARTLPHPALDARPYCRIETYTIGRYQIIALGWRGDHAGYPAARYAFMLGDSGFFFQFESLFNLEGMAQADRRGIDRPVWLTLSGPRRVQVLAVLTDWPSYERAKEIIASIGHRLPPAIVELTNPPGQIHAIVNYSGAAAPAAPVPQ